MRFKSDLGQSATDSLGIHRIERTMMTNKLIIPLVTGLLLTGCSMFGDDEGPATEAINDPVVQNPYAPFTDDMLDVLPEGLFGDVENQAHTNDNLRGDDDVG